MTVSDEQRLGEFCKVVIDVDLPKAACVEGRLARCVGCCAGTKNPVNAELATHVLETSTICGQPLIQRDGVTLVVLPVTDTRRDLPILLILDRRSSRRRLQHRRRRFIVGPRDLFVLEARRFERVLCYLCELDDPLFTLIGRRSRGVTEELGRSVVFESDGGRTSGFDVTVRQAFEGGFGAFGGGHYLFLGWSFEEGVGLFDVVALGQWDQV
jgi:hypothetical protein